MSESNDVISAGRVAVVTGAASGIGKALCARLVTEGMRVVMADVEAPALQAAAAEVDGGDNVISAVTDVSDLAQVQALRDAALDAFGAVHLVCNNAGVGGPHAPLWEISRGDLEWVLGVNMWGVINGIQAFVPGLVEQGFGHVLNTSSIFGLFAGTLGIYGPSKHAVVGLSEALHLQLREAGSPVGVSVLCPGGVITNFASSARNRPASAGPQTELSEQARASVAKMDALAPAGRQPAEVADIIVDAIREGRFYIRTSTNRDAAIEARYEAIRSGAAPTPPMG